MKDLTTPDEYEKFKRIAKDNINESIRQNNSLIKMLELYPTIANIYQTINSKLKEIIPEIDNLK